MPIPSLAATPTPKERLALFVASGFGSGYAPTAPGTFGTAAAAVIVILLKQTALPAQTTLLALTALATIACLLVGATVERLTAGKDPQFVVMDEFAGFFIALVLPGNAWPSYEELLVAFLLFRLFDIIKPPPARQLQSLRGGLGIVIDDLIAGLYALGGLYVFRDVRLNSPF